MDGIVAGITALFVLAVTIAVPYLIYTTSNHSSWRGCAVGGCLGPVLGFIVLLIAIGVLGDAPELAGIGFLPFFVIIGAIIGAIVGAFKQSMKD